MMNAIVLLHEGFEEMEAVAPIDLLVRSGVDLCLASMSTQTQVRGRSGLCLQTDLLFGEVGPESGYAAVILPGGPGIKALRAHPRLCDFLRKQQAGGSILACICAAPLILLDAGLLPVRYTAHPATLSELPAALPEPIVWEDRVLTSRGAGTAIEFGLALVRALRGQEIEAEIADSICWS